MGEYLFFVGVVIHNVFAGELRPYIHIKCLNG